MLQGALLPAAQLLDENAGNLIYTVKLGVGSAEGHLGGGLRGTARD